MAVMTPFTPVASTIGGILIGLSAVLLMLFNGRIAGISGILARVFPLTAVRMRQVPWPSSWV